MGSRLLPTLLVTALPAAPSGSSPADRLPSPRPEPCLAVLGDPDEGEMISSAGLGYEQVVPALQKVLPTALHCGRPAGRTAVALTFELVIGCDGLVRTIEATDADDAPPEWLSCVSAVISKADFPAHDLPDGMPVTYPVNVAW